MKKALKILVIFLAFLITGLFLGTILYSFYSDVLNHVTGTKFNFFQKDSLLRAFFYTMSCMAILICPLISFYRIKHPGGFPQFMGYLIVALLTWGIMLPFSVHFGAKYDYDYYFNSKKENLSASYFREGNNKIYYFTNEFRTEPFTRNDTMTVVIDTTSDGATEVIPVQDKADFELYTQAYPYRDSLVKESFQSDNFPSFINIRGIIYRAVIALNKGWTFWLAFLSLGLAICSIYGISNVSDWKLVNTCLVTVSVILLLIFNSIYFESWFDALRMRILDSSKFFTFLGKIMDDPLLVLINLLAAIGFSVTGLIRFIRLKKQGK